MHSSVRVLYMKPFFIVTELQVKKDNVCLLSTAEEQMQNVQEC